MLRKNAARQGAGEFAAEQGCRRPPRRRVRRRVRRSRSAACGSIYKGMHSFLPCKGPQWPIAEWAVSPAEEEACAKPKARRKPWGGGGGAFCRHAAGHRGGSDIDLHILCAAKRRSISANGYLGIVVPRGNCPRLHRRRALVAGGAALMARLLKIRKRRNVAPKLAKSLQKAEISGQKLAISLHMCAKCQQKLTKCQPQKPCIAPSFMV